MPGLSWALVPDSPRMDADPPIGVPAATGEDSSWSPGEAIVSLRTAGMSGVETVLPRAGFATTAPARRASLARVLARAGASRLLWRSLGSRIEVNSRWQ